MTEVVAVDPLHIDPAAIQRAADVLCAGRLVAFPTETVYGLGANALDPAAVQGIYAAKGRPATNPMIVHVASIAAAKTLVREWPDVANELAARFWPGPLTLILRKASCVPDIVTGGGDTVAIRIPSHPVALALLQACELPLAAPSANVSNAVSPTTAAHVLRTLDGKVELILDGGPTTAGVESTVLDLTSATPRVLRPGPILPSELAAILGPIDSVQQPDLSPEQPLRSPGMTAIHYAPRAAVECYATGAAQRVLQLAEQGSSIGWLRWVPTDTTGSDRPAVAELHVSIINMPHTPRDYAAQLFATLHTLDDTGVSAIIVDLPPADEAWQAVHDRLRRAATVWNP
ncbi:MAG: L-threonylcarbamoyladenylate synthase [Planctomycetota bacterium]|nr:L-threonylcarbamoyladenylate synthase [Planctomycetota bacterium]